MVGAPCTNVIDVSTTSFACAFYAACDLSAMWGNFFFWKEISAKDCFLQE